MAEVIRMPRLSDTMEEGNIVAWMKKVGEEIKTGDILAEVETDKATMDLESFQDGTLLYIGVEEGPVPVDGVIAIIGKPGEDYQHLLAQESKLQSQSAPANKHTATIPVVSHTSSEPPVEAVPVSQLSGAERPISSGRVKASPLAKSIAREAGIDISLVDGSGENGRIVKKDIEQFIKEGPPSPGALPAQSLIQYDSAAYGDKPVSQMRKTIARRLSESKFGAPHFYLTIEINMAETARARKMANEDAETRISFNDIIIKACAAALRKHPAINSSWLGDKIRTNKEVNIGVAVAVDEGLLVPVIRSADVKSLTFINQEVKQLATKAKSKKLQPEEMQGNTFTISNLGMFDIDEFTAIINPPDSCILAVGSIIDKPIVQNGEITIGSMMKVTLSCDHRVVDGATGAQFLQTLKSMLENPLKILA